MSKAQHFYLVDGSGYIFRAFHALPPLTRADGTPIGAVLGFSNMIWRLIQDTDADHIAIVFDAAETTFRNRIYDKYKANRSETPPELVPQFKLVREATDAFGLARIERNDFEADDLIATYAREAAESGAEVTIVSSDKDLMQLVSPKIRMFDPIKNKPLGDAEVREKFGVGPEKVVDVQALCGDSVDNVPGVKGITEESGGQLVHEYGDLESLLAKAKSGQLKEQALSEAKKLETKIFELAACTFEIGKPKQLGKILFEKLNLPGGQKGKNDTYSVNSDVLKTLASGGHEIASLILRWRFFTKVDGTFSDLLVAEAEQARISKQLVKLDDHVPLTLPLDDLAVKPRDNAKLLRFLEANGFRALIGRVKAEPANSTGAAVSAAAPALPVPLEPAETLAAAPSNYELIQDLAALERWIGEAVERGAVALDVETDRNNDPRAPLAGVAIALAPGRAAYVPLGHGGTLDVPKQIALADAMSRLKPLLEDAGVLKLGHNIKYAMEALANHGIAIAPYDDTMLISYVLEGGLHAHALDELASIHFRRESVKYKDLVGSGKALIGFGAVAVERARDYAAEAADMVLRLHRLLKPRLRQESLLGFYELNERGLPPVVAEMERAGIRIDRAQLQFLSEDFTKRLAELEREIHTLAGREFNIGSPKQLGEVLFDELKLPGGKKNKLGAYGTDVSILEDLARDHPMPARVLDWRQLAKLKSTYADALVEEIDPKSGRVHTTYALAHTLTGRMSSNEPNLQNIPVRTEEGRKIRKAFVAEPDHVLISADYSQIELRLAAHMADVGALKEAFLGGADIHAATASQVFGVPLKEVGADLRRRAKAINFGILYGMSAFGLAARIDVPQAEAAAYIKAYFERFPGIRDYMNRMKLDVREKGYVETLFGRRCHIPGIKDPNPSHRSYAEREAINAPLQGSAADIILRAMIRLPPALVKAGLKARLLLQVHDELVLEAPEAEAEKTAALVKEVMEAAPLPALRLAVPLVVETGMAKNWDEAH